MLIFDGSGSMWGKLEGEKQIKFDQARAAVRSALGKLAQSQSSARIGLMSFGHRHAGDCSDVQVVVPPERVPVGSTPQAFTERIMTPLDKLDPRGKGPLTAALREAAKVLGKLSAPRAIVLLHDDPDNCSADPCEALADLQKSAPGVMINVIGLGLRSDSATRYECLTKPTGGRHFNAQNGAQIAAGIEAAIASAAHAGKAPLVGGKTVATAAAAKALPGAHPVAEDAELAKPVVLERTGLSAAHLRALLSRDRLPLGYRVHWSIGAVGASPGSPLVDEADGFEAVVPLAPGSYHVKAVSGLVAAETTVTIGPAGQTLGEVTFNAAVLRLPAPLPGDAMVIVAARDGQDTAQPATPSGRPDATAASLAPGRRLGLWPHGQTSLLVPAQPLELQLEQGELRWQLPIDPAAGRILQVDLARPGGRVTISLTPPVGPPVAGGGLNQPVVFTLEEDDPDAPRGRREIARSAAKVAEFVVPPGVYMIAAKRGGLEVRERISVAPGEAVQRVLPLLAARMVLSARLGGTAATVPVGAAPDSFRVTRLDTEADTTTILAGPSAIVDVPPGRYRVEARRNAAAIRAEQVVEIRAGQYLPVVLEYQAGELRLELRLSGPHPDVAVAWRVLDAAGRLVWTGDEAPASTLLQAGKYLVRAVVGGQPREQAVEVQPGMISTMRVGL